MFNRKTAASVALIGALMLTPMISACTGNNTSAEQRQTVDLPKEFPEDFPLVEGKIVAADKLGDKGWAATVVVKDAAAQDSALADLKDKGFTEHGSNESDPQKRTYSLGNGTLSVTVVLTQADNEFLVDYSFAPVAR